MKAFRNFPNYDENTQQRIIELADINPNALGCFSDFIQCDMLLLVDEVARTCNNLDQLVSTLEDHRLKQMAELEADLAARQEKIMGTWVESFTAMNKAKENGRLNEYTSQLVLLVNSFLNKNEFRQAKL